MHLTYQQTKSCVAFAKRTHQMHHRRKENKTIFCAKKRVDQVHREMLRRESSKHTLRYILNAKDSKPTQTKGNSDLPNDHYESENSIPYRMEQKPYCFDYNPSGQTCWMFKFSHKLMDEAREWFAVCSSAKRSGHNQGMAD